MRITETPLSVQDLSEVRWTYTLLGAAPRGQRAFEVLEVHLAGPYGVGSDGRKDAHVLRAAVMFGWALWPCDVLLLNLTKLEYVWGDDLYAVIEIGSDRRFSPTPVPTALLSAEWNLGAYSGLVEGIGSPHRPYLTVDRKAALAWLAKQV